MEKRCLCSICWMDPQLRYSSECRTPLGSCLFSYNGSEVGNARVGLGTKGFVPCEDAPLHNVFSNSFQLLPTKVILGA